MNKKRIWTIIPILLIISILLSACGNTEQVKEDNNIEIPKIMAEKYLKEYLESVKNDEEKVVSYTENDDGSVTLELTEEHQEEQIENYENVFKDIMEGVRQSKAIRGINYDDDYNNIELETVKTHYTREMEMMSFMVGNASYLYQLFSGNEEAKVTILDEQTKEEIDEMIFPEYLESLGKEE